MTPLVSIITPAYNAASCIQETVNSVLACGYPNWEMIIVDDGSTDGTFHLLQQLAQVEPRLHIVTQANAGVSVARNHAIHLAQGRYILPLDADDLILPGFIEWAVNTLEKEPTVKIAVPRAEFFGDKTGEWHYKKYSPRLLARKNIIPPTALYRHSDYNLTDGYCETMQYREDWDFWLSMLKTGGEVRISPQIGWKYRVQKSSKRISDRRYKHLVVDSVNKRHRDFIYQQLGGPLHYQRTWSRLINFFRSNKIIGNINPAHRFAGAEKELHAGRNSIRQTDDIVIKRFATPNLLRGIIYGFFKKSKACRSYEYALRLQGLTPQPIAYEEVRICGILRESYYACNVSGCTFTFNDLINNPTFPHRTAILEAIGRFTATLHEQGVMHHDYSGGNILFNADGSKIEMIDLNRVHFYKHIDITQGCKNFERLNIDREALRIMAESYAGARGFDKNTCTENIIRMRWYKHVKQGITNL